MALGLYIHVPFCSAICNYCTFNRGLFDHALKTEYVSAAVKEIQRAAEASETGGAAADTIFFGGGTPSLLDPGEVANAAVFFLSAESRAVTGQVLKVDGGWSVVSVGPDGG